METVQQLSVASLLPALKRDGFDDLFHPPRLSKPEMHLLIKPFFLLDKHADRFKPIEYVYSVVENGKAVKRGWWVEPHSKYGLPGSFDRDVTIAIYELVNSNYFARGIPVPEIMPIGTLRDFASHLGIAGSGQNLAAIRESLKRLQHTLCTSEETFFDNKKKRYISVSFRLLKGVGFAGDDDGVGGSIEENCISFDECILKNLNSGYVMVIDVDSVSSLKTSTAKQLYAHLAYRFFVEAQDGIKSWVADYEWLTVHLGIKQHSELWRAKQQLDPAHKELLVLGYISHYEWDGWRIVYRPGVRWQGEQLRRKSGKRRSKAQISKIQLNETAKPIEPMDPLIPALAAFAGGLAVGEQRIKALGLTVEQARELCKEKFNTAPLD
jgi:Replication initiator protein A